MARRRANGEGSIYRREDGRYEASAYFVMTTGQRKRVRFYGKTRAEVHTRLTAEKAKAKQGVPLPEHNWRLGDYLDYWLENIIRRNRRTTTHVRYESSVRIHLKPGLGHVELTRLTVPQVQYFFAQQFDLGKSLRTVQIMREI